MPGPAIQPSIDAYGRYARASNLADYLELLALLGPCLNRKGLADLINDRGWVAKMDELFEGGDVEPRGDFDEPPEEDDATADEPGVEQANRVFDVLDERADLLGDLYPFHVRDDLNLREGVNPRESPYIALLAITLAHAHRVEAPHDVTRVVEDVVAATLMLRGLEAVDVGATSRNSRDFRETVERAGVAVGLQPTPHAAMTLVHANEEGLDALAHLTWGDHRPGAWVFIGQVTCAKSDRWSAKIDEPKPGAWRLLLNVGISPFAFLAIPHHIEPRHLAKLVQDHDRLVLDRIRLARFRAAVTPVEAEIVDAVLTTGVEALA